MEDNQVVKSRFKRVCVYCGSSAGKRDCYREAAIDLGQELVRICLHRLCTAVSCFIETTFHILVRVFAWRLRKDWILFTAEEALGWWVWWRKPFTTAADMFLGNSAVKICFLFFFCRFCTESCVGSITCMNRVIPRPLVGKEVIFFSIRVSMIWSGSRCFWVFKHKKCVRLDFFFKHEVKLWFGFS